MNKDIIFSFQGVHGAYSELAGKSLYPDSNLFLVKHLKKCLKLLE